MKLILFLLVLLKNGMKPTDGQLSVLLSSKELTLKTYFDFYYYDLHVKTCCKVKQRYCVDFVNSRGQVAPEYEGRILTENYIGVFVVRLKNLSAMDAGKYRCGISGLPLTYDEFELTISDFEVSGINQPPKPSISPNVEASTLGPQLGSEKHTEEHMSESENMVLTLAAVCSVVAFAVIISITLLVFYLKKSRDKSGTCGFCDSPKSPQEQNGTIYSTVVFKSYEDPSELYVNLQTQTPQHMVPSSTWESVEYSTVLRAPT